MLSSTVEGGTLSTGFADEGLKVIYLWEMRNGWISSEIQ